jgi:hypothetical protein
MVASDTFWWFSQVLEHYESGQAEIQHVEATRPDDPESNGALRATVDVVIPLCATLNSHSEDALVPTAATIREDGSLQIDFPSSTLPTADRIENDRVSVEEAESVRIEDGTILVTSIVTIAPDDGAGQQGTTARKNKAQQIGEYDTEETVEPTQSTGREDEPTDERKANTRPGAAHTPVAEGKSDHESDLSAVRNENLLPYEDTEYLQRLFESCDTFIEMAEVIEMDVSSETVRRYMIEAGVHEPTSYNTAFNSNSEDVSTLERDDSDTSLTVDADITEIPEEDSESTTVEQQPAETMDGMDSEKYDPMEDVGDQPLIADGIGLPDGVTIDSLADAVESSITVHDVTRELNIGRDEARQLLERLDLLDLVLTRVWKENNSKVSRAEIANRIRQSVTSNT